MLLWLMGSKAPENESSRGRKFHLWNFRSRERKFHGNQSSIILPIHLLTVSTLKRYLGRGHFYSLTVDFMAHCCVMYLFDTHSLTVDFIDILELCSIFLTSKISHAL